MADGQNSGSGWFWLVVVVAVLGGGWLYQQGGGDLFAPFWKPGAPHPTLHNVVAGQQSNTWQPAPGYCWINESQQELGVNWSPGRPHGGYPYVIAGPKEGVFQAAEGYNFLTDTPGDFRVVQQPRIEGIELGLDAGTFSHDYLLTNGSGSDLNDVNLTVTLFREDGQQLTLNKYWASWSNDEVKKINVTSHRYQKVTLQGKARRDRRTVKIDEAWGWNW